MKKVAVLMGGISGEREISLNSGKAIVNALQSGGVNAIPIVLQEERVAGLIPPDIDAVFLALHGGYGENGGVQADLDKLRIPYTGSGAAASQIAMDKDATKKILQANNIPTPHYEILNVGASVTRLEYPVVVKPISDGSSLGITLVKEPGGLVAALERAGSASGSQHVMVESYIPGAEWTVGIVADQTLPVLEIQAPDGWYGFEAKYTSASTCYTFPESSDLTVKVQDYGMAAFAAVGCRGLGRVDFRISPAGLPYVLEINTLPGFTSASLLPKAAAHARMTFVELCLRVLQGAKYG